MENKTLKTSSQLGNRKTMRTITLEEHFATPAFIEGPGHHLKGLAQAVGDVQLIDQLCDLDDHRIADMDAAGIDMQVLSLTAPGVQQLDAMEAVVLARDANDRLADAVLRHPSRFAGFATLPTATPDTAADELERMVLEHGFKGAVINGHTRGRYLDDEFFWPILERAEALHVPLYLHPTPPPQPVIEASYAGNYAQEVTYRLATAGMGLAHRDRDPRPPRHPQRSIRPVPEPAARDRPPGRGPSIHAAQNRFLSAHGSDEAGSPDRCLPQRKRPLHVQWLQLDPAVPRPVASGRR